MEPQDQQQRVPQFPKTANPMLLKATVVVLIIAVVGMLVIWKPWQPVAKASDRTISVSGEATIKAVPDEFVFSPSYSFKSLDKATALSEITKQSDAVTAKLKSLGVANADIKSNSNGYDNGNYYPTITDGTFVYSLSLTITTHSSDMAQKVQDYLVTTEPTGTVSPLATFSTAMEKSLQDKARTQAEKDARSKADQSAKNLGFKVTSVKTVTDGSLSNDRIYSANQDTAKGNVVSPQLTVQPGQNDLSYSVSVVYYIR